MAFENDGPEEDRVGARVLAALARAARLEQESREEKERSSCRNSETPQDQENGPDVLKE